MSARENATLFQVHLRCRDSLHSDARRGSSLASLQLGEEILRIHGKQATCKSFPAQPPCGSPEKWKIMATVAPEERTRLVSLSFSDILNQRFDSVVDELMPTGANDE